MTHFAPRRTCFCTGLFHFPVTGPTLFHDLFLFEFPITFQRIDDTPVLGKELMTSIAVIEGGLVDCMGKWNLSGLSTIEHHLFGAFVHRSRCHRKSDDTENDQTRPNPFHMQILIEVTLES